MKFNYLYQGVAFLFIIYLLQGCAGQQIGISPEKNRLPDARLKEPYYTTINISGGRVRSEVFRYKITPPNSGLDLGPEGNDVDAYNQIKVHGTPVILGDIKVHISGSTYGTMHHGVFFEKDYVVRVME